MTPEDLKSIRESTGLTQEQFAKELRVTKDCISSWEMGRRTIPGYQEHNILLTIKELRK